MKVVISGASGFIGKALTKHFNENGFEVIPLSRAHFDWHIHDFKEIFRGADVLIHLAGAPILKRWTKTYKKELLSSRVDTTKKIAAAFTLLKERPGIIISASAVGIYNTSDKNHTEDSSDLGADFLSDLVRKWELALSELDKLVDVRHVIFRLGVVLDKKSKAYRKMVLPIKLFVGGRIGKGRQGFSIVHLEDLIRSVDFAIQNQNIKGIYNLTQPEVTTNKEFTLALAKALKRPAFMIIPSFVLKIIYGGAANTMIKGQRVIPQRLQQAGFQFKFNTVNKLINKLIS